MEDLFADQWHMADPSLSLVAVRNLRLFPADSGRLLASEIPSQVRYEKCCQEMASRPPVGVEATVNSHRPAAGGVPVSWIGYLGAASVTGCAAARQALS